MEEIRVIPLVCPSCGSDLAGPDSVRMFYCANCCTAHDLEAGESTKVSFADSQFLLAGDIIFLPFWHFDAAIDLRSQDPKKMRELAAAPRIDRIWVAAFAMRNATVFGDPGFILTQRQTDWRPRPDGHLAGADLSEKGAEAIARYFALSMIDKRVDITGVDAGITLTDPHLVGVPFEDAGEKLMDGLAGNSFDHRLVSDIAAIRAEFKGKKFRSVAEEKIGS